MNVPRQWKVAAASLALGCTLFLGLQTAPVVASDHDDGETNIKSRNVSLTDLYVFREDSHSGQAADAANLVFVMNSNPRSLPRQQYFFNNEAVYSFHVSRKAADDTPVDGVDNIRFDFRFGVPDGNSQQSITMDVVNLDAAGNAISISTSTQGLTTPAAPLLGNPNATTVNNQFNINGNDITVFAGLREDPFFFDVEQFFKVRAGAVPGGVAGPPATFFGEAFATDFAAGYNVNSIVMSVPIAFLQANGEDVFDVWETISLPNDLATRQ